MDEAVEVSESQARREAQDELIVAALAVGCSYSEAAEAAGVSRRTVARRMAEPAFRRLVTEAQGEHVHIVAGKLTSLGPDAVATAESCLHDDDPRGRMAAMKQIFEWGLKYRDRADFEADVDELRRRPHPGN